ncbi:MAG: bifunctional sugar-1-phosphate nucleotidylyltransferase/acetyltransferase [Candidatus Methanomethylicaceae archaeon]
MVLAAGKGIRLEPFTLTRPKHLIPIAGATLLEHTLRSLKDAGIDEVLVVVHHMRELIKSHLGSGSGLGLKIRYVDQNSIMGTGDALLTCKDLVDDEPFMVVYGDIAFHPSIPKEMLSFFDHSSSGMVLGVTVDDVKDFGSLTLKGRDLMLINEKPKVHGPGVINGGIYILTPEIFNLIEGTSKSPERGEVELTSTINNAIGKGMKFIVMQTSAEKWVDVGRPWDILEANRLLMDALIKESKIEGLIEDNVHIKGKVVIERNAQILFGCYIEGPVWISSDSRVGPNCYLRPYTYLCRNVRVGNACEVKASVLMEDVHIGHLSYIGDSIIGAGCNLGAGTITANLRFDALPIRVTVKGERVNSGRRKLGAFLGDRVKTGINVSLYPGVKIGPDSWIAPHTAVNRDVPPNSLVTQRFEIEFEAKGDN